MPLTNAASAGVRFRPEGISGAPSFAVEVGAIPDDELGRLFARTGNHRSNAVEHADARPEQTAFRDRVRTNVGNEFGKTGGERFHDFFL